MRLYGSLSASHGVAARMDLDRAPGASLGALRAALDPFRASLGELVSEEKIKTGTGVRMATFTDIRTARKRHDHASGGGCDICRKAIEKGERYERFSATPHDEIWSYDRWSHMKAHHPYGSCLPPRTEQVDRQPERTSCDA